MRAVVYTDGGANPNPGFTGYGFTGYVYYIDELGFSTSKKPGTHTMTDKGFLKNDELKKLKANKVKPIFYLNGYGSLIQGTNNQGELLAVINSLDVMLKEPSFNLKEVHFKIDSKYVIGWVIKLLTKTYSISDDVKNYDMIVNLQANLLECIKNNIRITTEHVYGHTDVFGNELADQLATLGVYLASKNKTEFQHVITDVNEVNLWKLNKVIPDIVSGKRLYCRQDRVFNIPTYEALSYKDDNFLGTNKPCGYTVARLPKSIPVIEDIRELVHKQLNGVFKPYIMYMDTLGSSVFLRWLHLFSYSSIRAVGNTRYNASLVGDDVPVYMEKVTNGIMTQVYEYMDELHKQLDLVKDTGHYKIMDITDLFYAKDKKDVHRLLPDINSAVSCLNVQYTVDDKVIDLPLDLGTDIADRNRLKRIEKDVLKVEIIIKEFPIRLQYTSRITLVDGTVAIWSSINANNVFKKVIKKSRGKRFLLK